MADPKPQLDLDPASTRALIDALEPIMPSLARLVDVWRGKGSQPENRGEPSASRELEVEKASGIPADVLGQDLPKPYQGRSRRENLAGLYLESLDEVRDRRRYDVFAEYEACREIFTHEQWDVIYLYWNEGLTQAEIAASLRLKRSAVSGRLNRAKGRKQQHDERMRQEGLKNLRRMQRES